VSTPLRKLWRKLVSSQAPNLFAGRGPVALEVAGAHGLVEKTVGFEGGDDSAAEGFTGTGMPSAQVNGLQAIGSSLGEHTAAKVVQQREVKAGIGSLKAEGIRPIHAAADRIGGLAVGEPFDVLHHYH
jgi:hypothetical protein